MSRRRLSSLAEAIALLIVAIIVGCATPPDRKFALLHADMTRAEVIAAVGQPSSIEHHGDLETLNYELRDESKRIVASYYVILGHGIVESVGRE